MTSTNIKSIVCFILLYVLSTQSFAQKLVKCTETCCATQTKIGKTAVPKPVVDLYDKEYSATTYESWHGYPSFASENDWYGYNPNLRCEENPEYHVVEFKKDKTPHKVIYSKAGENIATHKALVTPMPEAISLAIAKSICATWKLVNGKEEIFRDGDKNDLKVYKVAVEKGKEKHILFFQINGNLLKDKEIKF